MVQLHDKVKNTIDLYLHALKSNNIPIKAAIFFGCYSTGNYKEWSDIDIALVLMFLLVTALMIKIK